jgi:phosphohistidine phosphatase SixA
VILLIRHGSAGDRDEWDGDDRMRLLDERGRRQADELVGLLEPHTVDRFLSSPALRCVQTVEPLARARGLNIEVRDELSEARQFVDGVALVRSLGGSPVVSCHGGLSNILCGESQKKAAVLVLDRETVVERVRAKGR